MRLLQWDWNQRGAATTEPAADEEPLVWLIDLDAVDRTGDALLLDLLDAAERRRLHAFRFDVDRRRFLRARAALRLILSDVCGAPPRGLVLACTDRGKPFLVGAGNHLQFNVSHSGPRMLLGLSTSGPIGVDVERSEPDLDVRPLLAYALTASEAAFVRSQPPALQAAAFLRFWVAKEALLKSTGDGLGRSMTEITLDVSQNQPVVVDLPADFPPIYCLTSWAANDWFAAAAVIREPQPSYAFTARPSSAASGRGSRR